MSYTGLFVGSMFFFLGFFLYLILRLVSRISFKKKLRGRIISRCWGKRHRKKCWNQLAGQDLLYCVYTWNEGTISDFCKVYIVYQSSLLRYMTYASSVPSLVPLPNFFVPSFIRPCSSESSYCCILLWQFMAFQGDFTSVYKFSFNFVYK